MHGFGAVGGKDRAVAADEQRCADRFFEIAAEIEPVMITAEKASIYLSRLMLRGGD
jgi:hypothetical protein